MKRQTIRKLLVCHSFVLFHLFKIVHLFFSPVLVIVACGAGVVSGSFAIFVCLFVVSLWFGRGFCGWVCPGAGLQELCSLAVKKKPGSEKFYILKYWISAGWIGGMFAAVVSAGGFHTIDLLWGTGQSSPARNCFMLFGVASIIIPLTWFFGRWAYCLYACWLAPLMIAGTTIGRTMRLPMLHLSVCPERCLDCRFCDEFCSMTLPVSTMVQSGKMEYSECILCGNCEEICSRNAIRLVFSYS